MILSKVKVLMSGTTNKNQGWHLVDPVVNQHETKEPYFRKLLSSVFPQRKAGSERVITFKQYFTDQWKFLKIRRDGMLSS